MKIIILVSAAMLFSFGSYAQADSARKMMNGNSMNNNMNHQATDKSQGDEVIMMNGKMMMAHRGEMTWLQNDTTMANGITFMADGTCIKKDGTKVMMKEGQHMNMSGEMMPVKESETKD